MFRLKAIALNNSWIVLTPIVCVTKFKGSKFIYTNLFLLGSRTPLRQVSVYNLAQIFPMLVIPGIIPTRIKKIKSELT